MTGQGRTMAAVATAATVLAVIAGCAQPTGSAEPGQPEPAPAHPEGPDVPAPIDLATLPDRLTIKGRLTKVVAGERAEPRDTDSDVLWIFQVDGGFLPIHLRGEEFAGVGVGGARGIVVAAPAGTVLPDGDARFAALQALAEQTGGALQVVGLWDGSMAVLP